MIRQPLLRAGNPLGAMNYHAVADDERELFPSWCVRPAPTGSPRRIKVGLSTTWNACWPRSKNSRGFGPPVGRTHNCVPISLPVGLHRGPLRPQRHTSARSLVKYVRVSGEALQRAAGRGRDPARSR